METNVSCGTLVVILLIEIVETRVALPIPGSRDPGSFPLSCKSSRDPGKSREPLYCKFSNVYDRPLSNYELALSNYEVAEGFNFTF